MRDLHELPKLRDGLSYLYVEHSKVEQNHLSIELFSEQGRTLVPAAALGVLMLGPGTAITHAAVKALADNGCSIVWCGEDGIRFYAQGGGETRKAYRLLGQARLASDPEKRMAVVRRMYKLRFEEPLPENLTIEQIRGFEGVRVREAYARASRDTGVPWHGRNYDRGNWGASDPVNRALSGANACLNGICHTAIVSGGYSPALGFIHTGKQLSFVYDVADLYKTEITIPLAFGLIAAGGGPLDQKVRAACRQAFRDSRLLKRLLPDIDCLLELRDEPDEDADALDGDPARPTPLWSPPEDQTLEGLLNGRDDS